MTVTKSDISANKPSTGNLLTVASGETVFADTENNNNLATMKPLVIAYNWIIDSGVELADTNAFTALQTFSSGLKVGQIDPLTTNGNIIINVGTGLMYKNSTVSGNQFYTKTDVDTAISTLTGAGIDLIYGDIQTANFNAVVGYVYLLNSSGGTFTATLPASPTDGAVIGFVDINGSCFTNNVTIGRNSNEIMDSANDLAIDVNYGTVYLIYDSSEGSWYLL